MTAATTIAIVKTGSALPGVLAEHGDFEAWITGYMAAPVPTEVRTVRVAEGDKLPDPRSLAGVVVTGSISMVSERLAWSERTAGWLADAIALDDGPAILGICYGHQLVAHALGGVVEANPRGREMGTKCVTFSDEEHKADPLLGGVSRGEDFHTSHFESVIRLPDGALRLATTALDPNHAFRIGDRVWGVQFHPEFDDAIMRGYVTERADVLRAEGFDPEAMVSEVRPTPRGPQLLRRFAELATSVFA